VGTKVGLKFPLRPEALAIVSAPANTAITPNSNVCAARRADPRGATRRGELAVHWPVHERSRELPVKFDTNRGMHGLHHIATRSVMSKNGDIGTQLSLICDSWIIRKSLASRKIFKRRPRRRTPPRPRIYKLFFSADA
jgi:hypothetical protein